MVFVSNVQATDLEKCNLQTVTTMILLNICGNSILYKFSLYEYMEPQEHLWFVINTMTV